MKHAPAAYGAGRKDKNMENKRMETLRELDFDALMQEKEFRSELDRRISRALETARGKWAQDTERRIQKAREEGERIARMNDEERMEHDFAQREADLNAREMQIYLRELRAGAVQQLLQRGLPEELSGAINYASEESVQESMNAVENAFRSAVQAGIEQRLRGGMPCRARGANDAEVSDADYYGARFAPQN